MQRLARFKLEEINQNATVLFEHYDEILKIVRAHLPPSTATLFAKPEIKSDRVTVEWYSELEGQPYLIPENESGKAALQKISPVIQQRLNAISALTQDLTQKGSISAEQTTWLNQLVDGATHDTRQIYLVNNEPVITGWGIGKKVEPPAPPPVVPVAAPKHRWCYWLLPLLLLLLGLLAWWWFNREPVVPAGPGGTSRGRYSSEGRRYGLSPPHPPLRFGRHVHSQGPLRQAARTVPGTHRQDHRAHRPSVGVMDGS